MNHSTLQQPQQVQNIPWGTHSINTWTVSSQFLYVVINSFPSWLVCGRNQVCCTCCSAQTANKLVSIGSAKVNKQALRTYCPNIYTVGLKVDDEENVSLRIISTSEFGFANLANYKCLMQSQHGAKPIMKSYLNLQNLPFYPLFAISHFSSEFLSNQNAQVFIDFCLVWHFLKKCGVISDCEQFSMSNNNVSFQIPSFKRSFF